MRLLNGSKLRVPFEGFQQFHCLLIHMANGFPINLLQRLGRDQRSRVDFPKNLLPGMWGRTRAQMAFYSAPEVAHVRVDVCDTYHAHLKSIDLTKMGFAVPVIDELATIPLDLWAHKHGYMKLQINMLGA
jgi:hypothetical protein